MRKEELSEGLIVGAKPRSAGFGDGIVRLKAKVVEFSIADDTASRPYRLSTADQRRHARVEIVDDKFRTSVFVGAGIGYRDVEQAAGERFVVPHADLERWTDQLEERRLRRLAIYDAHDRVNEAAGRLGLSVELKGDVVAIDLDEFDAWLKRLDPDSDIEPEDTGAGGMPERQVADTRGGPRS